MSVDVDQLRTTKRLRIPSVATLLCFTAALLAVALYFFVVAPFVNRVELIREVYRQGGSVQLRERGPQWFRWVTGYHQTYNTHIADQRVGLLDVVASVALSDTGVTNEFIPKLLPFESLERLDLGMTGITDDCLVTVSQFSRLKELELGRSAVSGTGFKHLHRMQSLKRLSVSSTPIGDIALENLDGHPSLVSVYVYDCQRLSHEGMDRFTKRNPSVKLEGQKSVKRPEDQDQQELLKDSSGK